MKPLTEYWWVTCVILVLLWLVFALGESTRVLWEAEEERLCSLRGFDMLFLLWEKYQQEPKTLM
ncbi:hypothetical protein P5673_024807 [Acropora cervicornis]|uniref:Uncharacterized protein n=1 Tax=Acropora cervicornis TaxID=6130 RepID=A0AAD9Q303_ACRCE|nr:hypothetical protein P5673_024807 [Acropora cervicornis]